MNVRGKCNRRTVGLGMLLERDIEIRFNVALSVVYRRGLVYFFLYALRSSETHALRRPAHKRTLPCEVYAQKFQSVHGIKKKLGVRLEFSFYDFMDQDCGFLH